MKLQPQQKNIYAFVVYTYINKDSMQLKAIPDIYCFYSIIELYWLKNESTTFLLTNTCLKEVL